MTDCQATDSFRPSHRARLARGQPISELMAQALANPRLISLAAGFVDQQTLPVDVSNAALTSLFSNEQVARQCLQYGSTLGDEGLRTLLLDGVAGQPAPAHVTVDQVVLTAGSNQLLHLVAESILDPGDIVLCATPTYLVFLGTLANLGARAIGVETDEEGMTPEGLDEQLQRLDRSGEAQRVKAIYLVTYFDNPCGRTMPIERIADIIRIAERWSQGTKIHVIADEAYRQLRYGGEDLPGALGADEQGDTVVVAGTFSKSFSPGIRVGWGILPQHLVGPVLDLKGNIDFGSPHLNQRWIREVVETGCFDRHVQQIRQSYSKKLDAMLAAADQYLTPLPEVSWSHPQGGLYVWVTLPHGVDAGPTGTLFARAIQEGVLYVPGQYAFAPEGTPVCHNTMRLSFGVQTCDRIQEGMRSLALALESVSSC